MGIIFAPHGVFKSLTCIAEPLPIILLINYSIKKLKNFWYSTLRRDSESLCQTPFLTFAFLFFTLDFRFCFERLFCQMEVTLTIGEEKHKKTKKLKRRVATKLKIVKRNNFLNERFVK